MLSTIFYKLLNMSLIAALIGLIILVIRQFFDKKIPPIWKYVMWSLVIIALMMPYKLKTDVSLFSANHKIEQSISKTIDRVLVEDSVSLQTSPAEGSHVEEIVPAGRIITQEASYNEWRNNSNQDAFSLSLLFNKHFIVKELIPSVWLLGTLLILLAFAWTRFKLLKSQNNSNLNDEEFSRIQAVLSDCKSCFHIQKDIQITVQDNISSPAIMGIVKPTIFLPKYVSDMSESSISHILYHELAHYKRKDTLVNYLLLLFNAVYWFNPLIWLIFKFIRDDIEILTDEFVINKIGKEHSKSYSKSLVEVLANANRIPFVPKMLCMVDGKKNIERRISMIKLGEGFKKHKLIISVVCLAVIALIAGVFLTSKKIEHKIAIYTLEGMYDKNANYQELVKDKQPILTEKDITAYNKEMMMLFLSDEVMQKYHKTVQKLDRNPNLMGGSHILGVEGEGNVFVITIDDTLAMAGTVHRGITVSYIPEGFHIEDCSEGMRIYLPQFMDSHNMEDAYFNDLQREYKTLAKAFEEMDLLTDKIFDMPSDYKSKFYDTDALWKNRTEFVGDNSKVGGIINNLVFPDGMSVNGFKINSDKEPYSLEIYLKEDKNLIRDISNRTENGKKAFDCLEKNAAILLTLVKNLSKVDFINDDDKTLDISFVGNDFDEKFKDESLVKNYFPIETLPYDAINDIFDFYRLFDMDFDFDKVMYGEFFEGDASTIKEIEEENITWDIAPMVYVDGSLYIIDSKKAEAGSKLQEGYNYIGDIQSTVDGSEEPKKNFESNDYSVGAKVYKKDDVFMLEGRNGKYQRFIKVKQTEENMVEKDIVKYTEENNPLADKVEKNLEDLLKLYPEDIDKHDIQNELAYDNILKMGDDALNYMLNEFKNGRGAKNRGVIMMLACREILGAKDNVEGDFYNGMDWYKQFVIREEVKVKDFEYFGDDEVLNLVYNTKELYDTLSNYFEDGGFAISAVTIEDSIYEEDYLKVFFHLRFSKFKLYKDDDKDYILDETGGLSAPFAITYKKDDKGKYQFVSYDMAKDGAYYAPSIEEFCTTPVTHKEIEGLADTLINNNSDELDKIMTDNMASHLAKYKTLTLYDPYGYEKFKIYDNEKIKNREYEEIKPAKKMHFPLDSKYHEITSYFGKNASPTGGEHKGVDIAAPKDSNIYAALGGEVIVSEYADSEGEKIVIDHGNGLQTAYAHASKRLVEKGDKVKEGDVIATVGATGKATGNHLHFEVLKEGVHIDPLPYLIQP